VRFLSLFSGIEAASVAWLPLGWECVAVSEIDTAASAVLAHHYPEVPNLGDVTRITEQQIRQLGKIDVVIFGSPCQDLSIAGKRAGLEGSRSGLFFDAGRIIRWSNARFALFENVPGLFSSNEGRDFAAVVRELVGLDIDVPDGGWRNTGVAIGELGLIEWSVLDAQWFGVPQRRRRIFALADFGDWRNRQPILFNPESLSGDSPPSRKAGKDVAPTISARTKGGGGLGTDFDLDGGLIASTGFTSHCLNAGGMGRIDYETETLIAHSLRADGLDASGDGTGRGTPLGHNESHANAGGQVAIAFNAHYREDGSQSINHACAQETNTGKILRELRNEVGEEAFTEWGLRVLNPFHQTQILRSEVLRQSTRGQAETEPCEVFGFSSESEENMRTWAMRRVRSAERFGRSPQGRELAEQLARELTAPLPQLSPEESQITWLVLGLWESSEGIGVLRQALSAVQEMGRPAEDKGQPVYGGADRDRVEPDPWLRCARVFWEISCERLLRSPLTTSTSRKAQTLGGQGSAVRRLTPL
jgi:DNA (cytosine-5)-methyltransferase 1